MSKPKTNGTIKVRNVEYFWEIMHYGGASNMYENYRGIAVSVKLANENLKELLIEFPFSKYKFTKPNKSIFEKDLLRNIEEALDSGWDPNKRGKKYTYQPSE